MVLLSALLDKLKDEKISSVINSEVKKCLGNLDSSITNKEKLSTYVKVLIIEEFLGYSDDLKRSFIALLSTGYIKPKFIYDAIRIMNTANAKASATIEPFPMDFIKNIICYKNNTLYDDLEDRDGQIETILCNLCNQKIIPIEEIESHRYGLYNGYRFSDYEIEILKRASMFSGFIDSIHSVYDEDSGDKTICNYDAIEDEVIKRLVPYTNKDNPPFVIKLDDEKGTLISYDHGEIRVKPFTMKDYITLVKSFYIRKKKTNCLGANYEVYNIVNSLLPEDEQISLEEASFEYNISFLGNQVYEQIGNLDRVYSRKMIDKSKDKISKMDCIALKYSL